MLTAVSKLVGSFVVAALLVLSGTCALSQQLPDAPSPQNNAPAPPAANQDDSTSKGNPETAPNTRPGQQSAPPFPESSDPTSAPPPGSQQIKTVPPGSVPNPQPSARDEMFTLVRQVNFIAVPVTVKDRDGKMVDGLLANDFSVYEDGQKQRIKFFTSDPLPLSVALVVDVNLPNTTLKKIEQTYSALDGSFGPFDEVSVFTYGNTVSKQADFGNSKRTQIVLNRLRELRGQNSDAPVGAGPMASGPTVNNIPVNPGSLQVQTPPKESYVLNDAILTAAQDLAHRPRENRKIIFVISDGKELGSRANYQQVLKVLLTNEVAVYAIGVDTAAMPVVNKMEKMRIPGQGYADILPRYANATGGDVLNEFSREAIESAYQRITAEARNQYTLGYTTPQTASSTFREIEVRVKRPSVSVYAKHGYYPLPPPKPEAPAQEQPDKQGQAPPGQPGPGER